MERNSMSQRRLVILVAAVVALFAIDCRNATDVQVEGQGAAAADGPRASSGTPPDASMARDQIPARFRWDITPLVESDAAFDQALTTVAQQRTELEACRGQLAQPARLEACLDLYFQTRLLTNRLTLYS
jgi:hypothetical protein